MISQAQSNSDNQIIKLEDARKIYQMGSSEVKALAGVTLSFKRGSFWAIMGPSGSGKSTMMNILGCLDRLSSGRYILEGHDVSTLEDDSLSEMRLRHLGFIFQSFNLIPQLSVQRNIELPLYYLGWEAHHSAERARELAGKVGLGERLNHRPSELSGGQMQRVAVARALANDPQIIFADEPTGNLDTATGKEILALLTELNEQGKTIIMVTHEADVAAYSRQRLHMLDGVVDRIEGEEQ
ncbi:MAG: ABC transporter ATP-binding protein [Phycisphaerae bacterium]|nr:ABC transporter ATP-binding protein [Phycisphaerae bacterium]MDD5381537.1 ABC transporter ATP-binding protein [Phycisphaerae bacterium]